MNIQIISDSVEDDPGTFLPVLRMVGAGNEAYDGDIVWMGEKSYISQPAAEKEANRHAVAMFIHVFNATTLEEWR